MDITGLKLTNIVCSSFEESKDSFERIILLFEDQKGIVIKVNEDTDELIIEEKVDSSMNDSSFEWAKVDRYIGKKIINSWQCTNNDGYFDLLVLAIGDFLPKLFITVAASQLFISECSS